MGYYILFYAKGKGLFAPYVSFSRLVKQKYLVGVVGLNVNFLNQ